MALTEVLEVAGFSPGVGDLVQVLRYRHAIAEFQADGITSVPIEDFLGYIATVPEDLDGYYRVDPEEGKGRPSFIFRRGLMVESRTTTKPGPNGTKIIKELPPTHIIETLILPA